ncbi:MAG TPA: hypothetical protein VFM18_23620 [Methanosarcina sp.]|nr:hypothetical protein [Methanosarcina sp.]
MKRLDLAGKRKGRLTIIDYSHSHIQPSGQKRAIWNAICDCGNKTKISTANFISEPGTRSCGCLLQELYDNGGANKKAYGEAHLNYKFLGYKNRAKSKKIEFDLTKEKFKNIIIQNCYYCGLEGTMHHISRSTNGRLFSNGIDRKDSKKGYVENNCVPCCRYCNVMKNNLTEQDFLNHIKRIFNHASIRERL